MNYTFSADVAPFVGAMGAAIAAAKRFEAAVDGAKDAELGLGADGVAAAAGLAAQAAAMEAAAKSARDLRDAHGGVMLGGLGATGAMRDFRRSLTDTERVIADAERGINDLQAATSRSEVRAISAAHGLRNLGRGGRDGGGGLRDLERAAGGAARTGGGLAKLMGLLGPAALPAAIAGLVGLAAGAAPAILSLGAGMVAFGALAAPALSRVKTGLTAVTTAQKAYTMAKAIEARDPTTAHLAAQQRALTKLQATWAAMPAPVRGAVAGIRQFEHAWSRAAQKSGIQKAALTDIRLAAAAAKAAIPAVTGLAKAFQPVIAGGLKDLGKEFRSKGFRDFISTLKKDMGPAAHALKGVGSAFGGFITQLTGREAKPGTKMLESIGKFLKTITPGAVTGLVGLTNGVTGLFNALNSAAKSPAMSSFVSHAKQLWHYLQGPGQGGDHQQSGLVRQVMKQFRSKEADVTRGIALGHLKGINISRLATFHLKTKIDRGGLGKTLADVHDSLSSAFKASQKAVKVKIKADHGDIAKQVQDAAKTGGAIPLKGKVTLSGLGAGIKSQIANLKIPDSKVKVSIQVTGAGSARAAMASVVGAARKAAAGAAAALGGLGAAGAAAGAALDAGLAGAISAGAGAVVAAAAAVAGAAAAAVRRASGISSPSKVWHGLGRQMIAGLILGLQGGKAEVQAAARAISGAAAPFKDAGITSTIRKLREDVRKAFRAGDIGRHQRDGLLEFIDHGNQRLMKLAQQRAKIMGQIRAATALAKSVTQGAIASADITGIAGSVAAAKNKGQGGMTIQQGQQEQLGKIREFTRDIRKLKREGLDKTSIRQLLAAGVSGGLPAAQQLLASGKAGVRETAKLQKEIAKASRQLGVTGANAAYESASQIGKGLASGLRAQLKPVVAAMRALARALIAQLRHALGLKPGEGLGGLLDGLGGGGGGHGAGGGGAGHHRRHHPKLPPTQMLPGGGHLIRPGPVLGQQMHPGWGGGPRHAAPVIHHHTHITVTLDGREVATSVQTHTLRRARRNTAAGLKPANRAA